MLLMKMYRCPQCLGRLVRVTRWLGYGCEHCKIAVTLLDEERVRITLSSGDTQTIMPLAEICVG